MQPNFFLFYSKNNQKQSGKSKQNGIKLFMYKIIKSKENKIVPTPENPSIEWVKGLG